MERSTGIEPVPGPWQGPVLPLYYDRSNSKTLARPRCVGKFGSISSMKFFDEGIGRKSEKHPGFCGVLSANLQHACRLHDGRLPLAFGKLVGLRAVRIYAGKPLTVFVKNSNLPVLVFAPFVFPEFCAFPTDLCLSHNNNYLNDRRPTQVPFRVLPPEG
jgi:hypothetical protein